MLCTECGRPIVLVPSAKERAKKHGKSPSFYTKLFTVHAQCQLDKRKLDTSKLMKSLSTPINEESQYGTISR